jgi:hypothetical protein
MGGALVVGEFGQEVLDAIERALSAPEELRVLGAVTFLETIQQVEEKVAALPIFPTTASGIWQPNSAPLDLKSLKQIWDQPTVFSWLLRTSQPLRGQARMLLSPFQ